MTDALSNAGAGMQQKRTMRVAVVGMMAALPVTLAQDEARPRASREPQAARPPATETAPRPRPQYSPEQVIGFQIAALRDNDAPVKDAGITTAFAFASPTNRDAVGPLPRFVGLVKSQPYRALIGHVRAERGALRLHGGEAEQRVTVTTADGERASFLFTLVRLPASAPCGGCWMTDGVLRLPSFEAPAVVRQLAMLEGHEIRR